MPTLPRPELDNSFPSQWVSVFVTIASVFYSSGGQNIKDKELFGFLQPTVKIDVIS